MVMTNVEIDYEDQNMQFETRTHVGFSPGVEFDSAESFSLREQ
jgi:hypothetical protein